MTKQNDRQVRVARGAVRSSTRAVQDGAFDQVPTEVGRALRELSALRAESAHDRAFRESLHRVGFDPRQVRTVLAALDGRTSIQEPALRDLAAIPAAKVSTERLTLALNRYLSSPECRRELHRPVQDKTDATRHVPDHEFAPFIASLCSTEVMAQVRAETLARLAVYVRSNHAAQDFGTAVSDQPSVQAMREVLERLRAGETVTGPELERVLDQRFRELFEPIKVVPCPQTRLPVAIQVADSSYAGRVSADSPQGATEGSGMVDAFLRDALDPHRIHLAAATSSEDTSSQRDQLARHATAIRNSIEMELPPFSTRDEVDTMTFISPALLTDTRVKQMTGTTTGWSASEREAIESLALVAMTGHMAISPRQVDLTAILRYTHQPIGAVSGAHGGQEPAPERLVRQASTLFARAAQALSRLDFPLEAGIKGPATLLLTRLHSAGYGLALRLPKDAEHGLRQALPALKRLAALRLDETAEMDVLGDQFDTLVTKIEAIGPDQRAKPVPTGDRIPVEAHAQSRQDLLVKQDRAQVLGFLQASADWSPGIAARWAQARDHASPKVWEALLRQDLPLYALDARYNDGQAVLDMTPQQQGAWMRHRAQDHLQRQRDQVTAEAEQPDQAERYFARQDQADQVRLNLDSLTEQDLGNLNEIQLRATAPVWNGLVNQVCTIHEVMAAVNDHGTPLLESSAPTQAKWAAQRVQAHEAPAPVAALPARSAKASKSRPR